MQTLVELIAKKRDGGRLSNEHIERLVRAFGSGELADYQMTALCMAIFFRGMDDEETVALTRAMLHSGDVIDLSHVSGVKVDKHSTGGVGDKVSICLAPLVAACGVRVPMVSGRGLGHTGGTLDKLEAIPGFDVSLDVETFARIMRDVGVCMIGQTARIAPADKRMYALRDVTATVESIPLIVASILSKKLAEGIDALVLDVKVGRGAFMKTEADARVLAEALVRVGTAVGKRVVALLTDMNGPLGATIGNAIETREAIDVLRGHGPPDLLECTLALGAEMLILGGVAEGNAEARQKLEAAIATGRGARVFEQMIEAQGGDPLVVETWLRLCDGMADDRGGMQMADFNADGREDAIFLPTIVSDLGFGPGGAQGAVLIYHGVGEGAYELVDAPEGYGQPTLLAVDDVNGDERIDLAWTVDGCSTFCVKEVQIVTWDANQNDYIAIIEPGAR